jgi:hypothetical protein
VHKVQRYFDGSKLSHYIGHAKETSKPDEEWDVIIEDVRSNSETVKGNN